MKKFWISLAAIFLISCSPITGVFVYGEFMQKDVYQETFYAELNDKIDRLKSIKEPKIVFIGGSSLIFGLRSEEIEKATGYPVVDFGLYASLGTTFMMDIAKDYIRQDDIVVLAPEINSQTYSDYVGYTAALKCFENTKYKATYFNIDDNMEFFFHYFGYVYEKGNAKVELKEPYTKSSFNEYGDIDNEIVYNNQLEQYYDPTQLVEPSKDIIDNDFIKEVNKFCKAINRKKAKMYFSFSPTNALSLKEDKIEEFESYLDKKLRCELLGSVKDMTYHQYYFYDTNFHLNKAGSYLHSSVLANLLKEKLNIENDYVIEVPDAPKPAYYDSGIVETIDGLILKQVYSGNTFGYVLNGFTEEMKNITEYTIPRQVNGVDILLISEHAFSDMPNLTKITIPSTITQLVNPLFKNCPNVIGVYLEHEEPPMVCSEGLIDGTSPNCKIYVPEKSFARYFNDYSWANYRGVLAKY